MARRSAHPIVRRNFLLAGSGVLMVTVCILRPATLLLLVSRRELINLAILALVAFFAAISITRCGETWLRGPDNPWYIRRGATIVLPLMLLLMTTLVVVAGNPAFRALGSGPLMSEKGAMLEFVALQIIWVVLLEWPHYEDPPWPRIRTRHTDRHPQRPTAYLR
jgi:hypothetical protein